MFLLYSTLWRKLELFKSNHCDEKKIKISPYTNIYTHSYVSMHFLVIILVGYKSFAGENIVNDNNIVNINDHEQRQ